LTSTVLSYIPTDTQTLFLQHLCAGHKKNLIFFLYSQAPCDSSLQTMPV